VSGSKHTNRVERLERQAAKRVKPVKLEPERAPVPPGERARRAAQLDQLAYQLLTGQPGSEGPYPSLAMHEQVSSCFRHKHLGSPVFAAVEQLIASDQAHGPAIFGPGWKFVAHPIFNVGSAVKRRRAPLEPVDFATWRRARWAAWLASDEGKAATERGLVQPAAADLEAMDGAAAAVAGES
jgi:hypothetical protein